ncbi:hypothetical protein L21SP5_01333 [Salinivirga cyanobacteriivorans]|uniref:PKD domain-containing protein n=1 Tax=Salinivirga cyanobacteriivorans TaxID=1307839 RepID=A0A0S2HY92_9BACT|nr:gliding motility-associated C-terminal domain-containing protein [Salinivirga cyanobacteriivorans]ALO14984.1 hypothetical protein L21SP5_01333 [Salinivirga cyanobacteriivorans]
MIRILIIILALFLPQIIIGQDFTITTTNNQPCVGETITLSHTENCDWTVPGTDGEFFDQPDNLSGVSSILLTGIEPGEYTIDATTGAGNGSVVITVSTVSANFEISQAGINGYKIQVSSDIQNTPYLFPITFSWDFGDGTTIEDIIENNNNEVRSFQSYTYDSQTQDSIFDITLTVTNNVGCSASLTQADTIHKIFKAPNVFTPNGDGVNDFFTAQTDGQTEFDMYVYSRWGNVVYESEKPTTRVVWDGRLKDGKKVSSGIYYYVIIPRNAPDTEKLTGFVHVFVDKE